MSSHISALLHDLPISLFFYRLRYRYGCPRPPLPLSLPPFFLASSFACGNQLFSTSALCYLAMKPPAALTISRYHLPAFLATVGHSTVSTPNRRDISVDPSLALETPRCCLAGIGPMSFLVGTVPGSTHRPSSPRSRGGLGAHGLSSVRTRQK